MTKYIKNEFGGVHSVSDEKEQDANGKDLGSAFDRLKVSTGGGQRLLPAGWSEITAAEARKLHPQLFGAADPIVRQSADEVRREFERKRAERDFNAEFGDGTDDTKE